MPDLAETCIAARQSLEPELRGKGAVRMSLFGSVARGEAHVGSDVDIAIVVDPEAKMSLIELAGLKLRLGEVLGRPVEVLTLPVANPWIRESIERDSRHVF